MLLYFLGKALNGSTFVHIRLRLRENSSGIRESVRNLASIFTRRTGIPMEGTEVYTRTVPADREKNGTLKLRINKKKLPFIKRKILFMTHYCLYYTNKLLTFRVRTYSKLLELQAYCMLHMQ